MADYGEFERTLKIGERTIHYMREYETPASPRNYELLYTYASGYNKNVVKAVRESIQTHGRLLPDDADRIYDEVLAPANAANKVEEVGSTLSSEIEDVIEAIQETAASTGAFGTSIEGMTTQLGSITNGGELKQVVKALAAATREMSKKSRELEGRLEDSTKQIAHLHQSLEVVRTEANTDELTGIANRKRFDKTLEQEMAEAIDQQTALCLVIGDIDHFKKFNDTFGHQTGDQVLRLVAHTLKTNVKGKDLAARYGGEEFAIILPETEMASAVTVANQIREAIKSKELVKKSTGENLGRITMSMGVARFRLGETADAIVARADAALYAAKHAGRDQVKDETTPGIENAINAA